MKTKNKKPEIHYIEDKRRFTNHNKPITDKEVARHWFNVGSADYSLAAYRELCKRALVGELQWSEAE